ncbi:LD-carboxypeptidase [Thermosulfurimonas marina]|uniref:LD-carboxypeptidase n=1 Tax=Thermosulfurimonas marina TaxID=2047767 RepID=A0A6H1WSQ4_9BACT|nr:LD-carboxypeptidase [Thermosulfurimonas marina]QJA06208.1 LD-carboxypeptidase [Thermosulfurimonas marina]
MGKVLGRLRPGARVRVVAPAGAVEKEALAPGLKILKDWGLRVEVDPGVFEKKGYLAGEDRSRAEALLRAAEEAEVLWAARGGYGSARLLPLLAPRLPEKFPPLLGFSDLSALLNLLAQRGLPVWHAPTVCFLPRLSPEALSETRALLFGEKALVFEGLGLSPGKTQGPVFGGNLATLSALLGTPYFPSLRGALLFLEDLREPLYRLDRYLTHLRLSGVLDEVAGILLGDLGLPEGEILPLVKEVLPREKPCGLFPYLGHKPALTAFPLGVWARLEVAGDRARWSFEIDD